MVVRRSPLRAAVVALRPRQWLKNLLLFAGIIFAAGIDDPIKWFEAVAAFVAYCSASSAAYLVNDLRDAHADRLHPVKQRRPIAAGDLARPNAAAIAVALAVAAFAIAVALGTPSVVGLLGFVALQVAYTAGLKHVVFVDVLVIAGLFVVRAAAGAVAVSVRISPWLLVCTGLLALFLALGKRRAELVLVGAARAPGRRVLKGYSVTGIDRLLAAVSTATIAAYSLYAVSARDSRALALTIPFVAFGLGRYLWLLHRREVGEEPENVLLGDVLVLGTVAAWAVVCAAILIVG